MGIGDIIGRTIAGVIVKEGPSPNTQMFLLFSDGSYYELYSLTGRIEGLSRVHRGDAPLVRALGQTTVLEL